MRLNERARAWLAAAPHTHDRMFAEIHTGRIVSAAIQYGDMIASMPRPARHHTIIHAWHDRTDTVTRGDDPQGFLTSKGFFVDRRTALRIATACGQVVEKHGNPHELYSEDLW